MDDCSGLSSSLMGMFRSIDFSLLLLVIDCFIELLLLNDFYGLLLVIACLVELLDSLKDGFNGLLLFIR